MCEGDTAGPDRSKAGPVEIRLIQREEDLLAMEAEWNRLVAASGRDLPFLRHEWFASWWRAFGAAARPCVAAEFRGSELAGLAPLLRRGMVLRGVPVRGVTFLANQDSPRCEVIVEPGREAAAGPLVRAALERARWDVLLLENVAADWPGLSALTRALAGLGRGLLVRPGLSSPYLRFRGPDDSAESRLSSKARKTLRNIRNRVRRLGGVARELDGPDVIERIEPVMRASWKFREGKTPANRADRWAFFRDLTPRARALGWLRVWGLFLQGRPAAFEYHLAHGGVETALLADYDAGLARVSPGACLDAEILGELPGRGITEYDMAGSADPYKLKWRPAIREHRRILVFNRTAAGRFLHLVETVLVPRLRPLLDRAARARRGGDRG